MTYDEALVKAISGEGFDDLHKAHVQTHMMRTKTGKLVEVKEHEDSRSASKKADDASKLAETSEDHDKASKLHRAAASEYWKKMGGKMKHGSEEAKQWAHHSQMANDHDNKEIDLRTKGKDNRSQAEIKRDVERFHRASSTYRTGVK